MNKKTTDLIITELLKMYPNVTVTLNFKTPFELLLCLVLAAQCTDKRVNEVTGEIFKKYNKPEDFCNMDVQKLEDMIHSCGFYRNKAKSIIKASNQIINEFNGIVPNNIDDLQKIAGIGRKSANCILSDAFKTPVGIAIDTHAKRICNRLDLSKNSDPSKIEQDILKIIDKKHWGDFNLIFVTHGRNICDSRKPKCDICNLNKYCKYYKEKTN